MEKENLTRLQLSNLVYQDSFKLSARGKKRAYICVWEHNSETVCWIGQGRHWENKCIPIIWGV